MCVSARARARTKEMCVRVCVIEVGWEIRSSGKVDRGPRVSKFPRVSTRTEACRLRQIDPDKWPLNFFFYYLPLSGRLLSGIYVRGASTDPNRGETETLGIPPIEIPADK